MGLRIYTDAKPLNDEQQQLVMEYFTFTKGRGSKLAYGDQRKGRGRKLAELKQRMVAALVPNELIYGF